MTRAEILENYEVNADGIITSPGKFEGEMLYVPYFWEKGLEACADYDDGKVYGFEVCNEDVEQFPELEGVNTIALEESESGFVNSAEYQSLAILEGELEDAEDEEPSEPDEEDITTSDHQHFYQSGKLVLTVGEDEDHVAALKAYMDKEQFWPNCWFISDHGNAHLMNLQ